MDLFAGSSETMETDLSKWQTVALMLQEGLGGKEEKTLP